MPFYITLLTKKLTGEGASADPGNETLQSTLRNSVAQPPNQLAFLLETYLPGIGGIVVT